MSENETYPPSAVVRMIAGLGDRATGELRPNVNALTLARKKGWTGPERNQYIRLCVLLGREDTPLPEDVLDVLIHEFAATRITDRLEPLLLTMLSMMKRVPSDYPCTDALVKTFNRWTVEPDTSWQARLYAGAFLNRLSHIDESLHRAFRSHMTRSVIEWSLDYHTTYANDGFDLRSRAIFSTLLSVPWSADRMENVMTGLDGAFNCCVAKLMEACDLDWFRRFIDELATRVLNADMNRRLSAQTLYDIGQYVVRTRRRLFRHRPETALSLTRFEEAVHRPHRVVVERKGAPKIEIELPGVRGFDGTHRLVLHDISADGCLAWIGDNASFEETERAFPAELTRCHGRCFTVWRHRGVIRSSGTEIPVRPGNEAILHDPYDARRDLVIDGASVVRYSHDPATGRLWLGFHLEKVLPRVQHKIDDLIASEK